MLRHLIIPWRHSVRISFHLRTCSRIGAPNYMYVRPVFISVARSNNCSNCCRNIKRQTYPVVEDQFFADQNKERTIEIKEIKRCTEDWQALVATGSSQKNRYQAESCKQGCKQGSGTVSTSSAPQQVPLSSSPSSLAPRLKNSSKLLVI